MSDPVEPTVIPEAEVFQDPPHRSKVPLADQAFRELKRRILDNEIPAGYQVLEQELVSDLGMSRTPVREAVVRLANEGLVEVRPRHGMRVLPVSVEDMREIYEILTALESQAAETVAGIGLADRDMARLKEPVDEMDQALEKDDLRGWAEADARFHLALVELSGNRRMRQIVGTCWEQAHRVRILTLPLRPKPVASNQDHRALVDAIARRDPRQARDIHHGHRIRSAELLTGLLEKFGLQRL